MRRWEAFLVGINLAFAAIGFFTYIPQLLATPVWLWVFTPDCPMAWLLFALAYVWDNNTFRLLAFASGIKYAAWTFAAEFLYWGSFGSLWIVAAVFAAHIILTVEVFLLRPRFSWRAAVPVFAFLALSDVSDYILGTYPWLPSTAHLPTLAWLAVLSTIFAPLIPLVWQTINNRRDRGGT